MDQTEKLVLYFYEHENALLQISVEEIRDVVNLATVVLAEETGIYDDLKEKAFELLCKIAILPKLSVIERWSLYWLLTRDIFVSTKFDRCEMYLEKIYAGVYLDIEKLLPDYILKEEEQEEKNGPVIIVTSQFLSVRHAPTRRVMDYAYTIKTKLGVDVKIINDAGMNLYYFPYMVNRIVYPVREELSKYDKLDYKDTTFSFYQYDSRMPDLQGIANMVYNIKKLKPRLVLNVGGSCLTSDLCRHFTKTATIPCNTSIPRGMSEYLVLCRDIREDDNARISRIHPWQSVVESVFNYIMPDDNTLEKYTREMFGIPENAWLITSAGNRMSEELSMDFLIMVDNIMDELPNTHFLVIGDVEDGNKIIENLKNKDKFHLAGKLECGSQAIRLADLYIQPTRKGGGRAAFEALYYGIPVITTKYGDTWDVCGRPFEVESYEEMAEKIRIYYNDSAIYQDARNCSKNRANELEDMKGMFLQLFNDLNVPYNEIISNVDTSQFFDIFSPHDEKENLNTENYLKETRRLVYLAERRLRENEWANVFHDTVVGSNWLKDVSLSPGRCALGYPALYALYRTLDEFQPKCILEMGLGFSTRVIGSYAGYFGAKHWIVEHDESWIQFFFDKHGKNPGTEVVCLERKEGRYSGKWINTTEPIKFYDNFANSFAGEKFDFIFVDGPQGSDEYSRVDITELLPECLADSFVIMVDDAERVGERKTVNAIGTILQRSGINCIIGEYDGLKNTDLIVSEDLKFLCSL